MVATDRVRQIFADARALQADALEMLDQGRIRNAAEKAWGATKRATGTLVLARTGEEPERTPKLVHEAHLVGRYYTRKGHLLPAADPGPRCLPRGVGQRPRQT
jgi:hypothetical protein